AAVVSLMPGNDARNPVFHMHHGEGDGVIYESAIVLSAAAAPAAPRGAGEATTDDAIGTVGWTLDEDIVDSEWKATSAGGAGGTHYVVFTGFGHALPESAVITGVQVDIERGIL